MQQELSPLLSPPPAQGTPPTAAPGEPGTVLEKVVESGYLFQEPGED